MVRPKKCETCRARKIKVGRLLSARLPHHAVGAASLRADGPVQCDEATPRCGQCARSHRCCTYLSGSKLGGFELHLPAARSPSKSERSDFRAMRLVSERTTGSGASFQRFSTAIMTATLKRSIISSSETLQSTWANMLRYNSAAVFSSLPTATARSGPSLGHCRSILL